MVSPVEEPKGLGELQHARGELRDFHVISIKKLWGCTAGGQQKFGGCTG